MSAQPQEGGEDETECVIGNEADPKAGEADKESAESLFGADEEDDPNVFEFIHGSVAGEVNIYCNYPKYSKLI